MMSEHDLEKLLGGFSADTLTAEERQQLYAAALHDQQLFNALADEQALKELLADPAVRRRLFGALAPPRDASRWRSWLDRFTSPAGLVWAGGVAVGVFAVVLGLRVYEASLRQVSETAILEEERTRASLEEEKQQEPKVAPTPEPATKDTPSSSLKRREQAAASRPRQEPGQTKKQRAPQHQGSKEEHAPVAALGKSTEQPASQSNLGPAPSAPAAEPEVRIMAQAQTGAASARTLFYAQAPHPKIDATAQEMEATQNTDRLALARKAPERAAPAKPLALRYRFVSDKREAQADVPEGSPRTVTFTLESNQDGYVQIWKRTGDSLPELVIPAKETGHISLKTLGRERHLLTVSGETDQLIVRFSRVPFGPITRQEAVMAGRGSPTQVREFESGAEEEASYVADPDVSATQLAIEIPFGPSAR